MAKLRQQMGQSVLLNAGKDVVDGIKNFVKNHFWTTTAVTGGVIAASQFGDKTTDHVNDATPGILDKITNPTDTAKRAAQRTAEIAELTEHFAGSYDAIMNPKKLWMGVASFLETAARALGFNGFADKMKDYYTKEQIVIKNFDAERIEAQKQMADEKGIAGPGAMDSTLGFVIPTAVAGFAGYKALTRKKGNDGDNDKTPPNDKKGMPDKKLSEMSQADQDLITGKKKAGPEIKASVETPVAETHGGRGGSKFMKAFKLAGLAGAATLGTVAVANATTNDTDAEHTVGDTDLSNTPLADMASSEINLKADFQEASMVDEALHKGHVLAHGFQDGIAGLVGAPEDLWNLADSALGGWLPGDHNVNNMYNFATKTADNYLISKPELKSEWDVRVHATGGMASWLIPVGGALKAAGAGARAVNTVKAFEAAENVVGQNDIAQGAATMTRQFIFQ